VADRAAACAGLGCSALALAAAPRLASERATSREPSEAQLAKESRRALQPAETTPITDANIHAAVAECEAEDTACQTGPCAFDCPNSQATYGRIADWDVGAVTRFNNWENGCTEDFESRCGGASPSLISWP